MAKVVDLYICRLYGDSKRGASQTKQNQELFWDEGLDYDTTHIVQIEDELKFQIYSTRPSQTTKLVNCTECFGVIVCAWESQAIKIKQWSQCFTMPWLPVTTRSHTLYKWSLAGFCTRAMLKLPCCIALSISKQSGDCRSGYWETIPQLFRPHFSKLLQNLPQSFRHISNSLALTALDAWSWSLLWRLLTNIALWHISWTPKMINCSCLKPDRAERWMADISWGSSTI